MHRISEKILATTFDCAKPVKVKFSTLSASDGLRDIFGVFPVGSRGLSKSVTLSEGARLRDIFTPSTDGYGSSSNWTKPAQGYSLFSCPAPV